MNGAKVSKTGKRHTVTLDGDSEFLRLVEYIVEILGIQLGSEEGIPMHYSKSAGGTGVRNTESEPTSRR